MRLIGMLHDIDQAKLFSSFLAKEGIENELEIEQNKDWGSDLYGTCVCRLWIKEEDQLGQSTELFALFQQDPAAQRFRSDIALKRTGSRAGWVEPLYVKPQEKAAAEDGPLGALPRGRARPTGRGRLVAIGGALTIYFILGCTLLFIISIATAPSTPITPSSPIPSQFVMASSITKQLLFDYPHAYELFDELIATYGIDKLEKPSGLPEAGVHLLEQYNITPYWDGVYPALLAVMKKEKAPQSLSAPLFEKIRQGEVWRLFTPILLHADIFHLLFNMLWLAVLGVQIEHRLGPRRYLFFIAATALVSNVAQYLMSGPNFLGFSGVLCAMLSFIWVRQARAPWEGYQLQRSTIAVIALFIMAMFSFQLLAFFLQIWGYQSFAPGIANTAHLSGAAIGALLALVPLFAWRRPL